MGFVTLPKEKREYRITMREAGLVTHDKPAFKLATMRDTMLADFEEFAHLGTLVSEDNPKRPGRHIYIDRGSPVLGVAHLDSVREGSHFWANNTTVACPTIDNRLGVWTLLHGLPSMGIYPDILLTENEEMGCSTAEDFKPALNRWNWMFSFDRMKTDVVLYQYEGQSLETALKKSGFTIGIGSYSDISDLEHLGLQAVNVGCTMADYHTNRASANLPELSDQLVKFAEFYRANETTKFAHVAKPKLLTSYSRAGYGSDYGNGYDWSNYARKGLEKDSVNISELVRCLRVDADMMSRIRPLQFFEGFASAEAWREECVIPEGFAIKGTTFTCSSCRGRFVPADTKYTQYYCRTLCKCCLFEAMDDLLLTPDRWQEKLSLDSVTVEGGM